MVQGFIIFKKFPRKSRNEYFKRIIFKFIPIKFFERDGMMAFTPLEMKQELINKAGAFSKIVFFSRNNNFLRKRQRRFLSLTGFTQPFYATREIFHTKRAGFTLVEIMITLAIIGVLATTAMPQFVKSRSSTQKSICINNLRQIDAAIDRWVFENNFSEGGALSSSQEEEAYSYLRNGKPNCPGGGVYNIGVMGTYPQITCTIEGHILGDSTGYLGR